MMWKAKAVHNIQTIKERQPLTADPNPPPPQNNQKAPKNNGHLIFFF